MPCKRIVNGRVVFWPERCNVGKKEILLDPKLTPMENVWRMVRIACLVRLAMFKLWSYDYQDMADLEIMVQMATYNKLLRMVRDKEYNRRYSFYLNVRSACWSVCQHVVDAWMQDIRQRYNVLDGNGPIGNSEHGSLTLFDTIAAHRVPRLMTESDYYGNYLKRRWFEYDRPCDRTKALRAESYNSYDEYCEDCLLFNVSDVLSYDDFVKQNYTLEERKIIAKPIYGVKANKAHDTAGRPRLAPDKYEAKLAYNREWYAKNKGKKHRKSKKSIAELDPEQREERRSYYRDWYKRNRERLLAYNAEYRASNREHIRQYSKDWYAKKKEKAVT